MPCLLELKEKTKQHSLESIHAKAKCQDIQCALASFSAFVNSKYQNQSQLMPLELCNVMPKAKENFSQVGGPSI